MPEDDKSNHAKNSNLIGNTRRMEEMAKGGLSATEQETTFKSHGINIPAGAVEPVLSVLEALRSKPLPRTAVTTGIANHEQIVAEGASDEDEGEDAFDEDDSDEGEDAFDEGDEEENELEAADSLGNGN